MVSLLPPTCIEPHSLVAAAPADSRAWPRAGSTVAFGKGGPPFSHLHHAFLEGATTFIITMYLQ
eukprot:5338073-Lingulodinium_polyedra.AAC.1